MKILAVIKGFVTNSSSANYWLNDGILEEGELTEFENSLAQDEKTILELKEKYDFAGYGQTIRANKVLEERVVDFSIWFVFSLILIMIFFLRKLKIRQKIR